MTTEPVARLIISMAIPSIGSMIVSSIYNFADTYYISQLGTSVAAVPGISQPLFLIIQAVSLTLAVGAGSYAARALGRKENDNASKAVSTSFFLSVMIGTLIGILSLIFLPQLMTAFGATSTILPHAEDYARYVIYATPFFSATFVMSYAIRQEGNVRIAVIGTIAGAIINIALDPLLIFVFDMGIKGAAVATSLSQMVSFTILFQFLLRGKCVVRLKFKYFSLDRHILGDVLKVGSPDFFRTLLASLAAILLNTSARPYGDTVLAGMTVCNKIIVVIVSALMGFGQGFQPMCGYNYGAKIYDRVKKGFRFTLSVGLAAMTVVFVTGMIFAPQIMSLFRREDTEFIDVGSRILRASLTALLPATVTIIANMLFQACGKAPQSAIIALSRNGIVFIPLILLMPRLWGLNGVIWAQPTADIITLIAALIMLFMLWKNLNRLEREAKEQEAEGLNTEEQKGQNHQAKEG
ncbi:MAG: MATE family efflux transporter [Lachnospiraceae bacterium]|nr:MATE family efflux transporter [Lachnospiraceae bacterium]